MLAAPPTLVILGRNVWNDGGAHLHCRLQRALLVADGIAKVGSGPLN